MRARFPVLDGTVTLGYYLDDVRPFPAAGAAVAEVDAATLRNPHLGPYSHIAPGHPPPRVGPFRLVEDRLTRSYAVLRYRAARPVRVTTGEAEAIARPLVTAPQLLYERPGSRRVSPFNAR